MTVLRSRKVVTNPNQQNHSPNLITNNKSSSPVVVTEIEPFTPDNKQMNNNNHSNETTPASVNHKLGLLVSSDSGRVLRRSARLSLNSSSYDVVVENVGDNSSRKRKAPTVVVKLESQEEGDDRDGIDKESCGSERVVSSVGDKSSRKRKAVAVKLENEEERGEVNGLGLGDVKVSMEVDTTGVVTESNGVLASDMDTEQSDKNQTPRIRSLHVEELVTLEKGDVNSKVVLLPDLNQLADDDKLSPAANKDVMETQGTFSEGSVGIELNGGSSSRVTRSRRFSREEKNKGVAVSVVDVDIGDKGKGKVVEVVSSSSDSDPDDMDEDFVIDNATRVGLEDKGKEKVVEGDSSSRPRDQNEEIDVGFMDNGPIDAAAADAGSLGIAAIGRAGTSSSRMRERFKDAARKNATRFAYFSHQQEEEVPDIDDDDEEDEPEPAKKEGNADEEDWPGPFSTAMKIINDRTANTTPQKEKKAESVPLIWVPKEKQQRVRRAPPSLQDLCMTIMSQHVDAITSLDSVPDGLRHKLTRLLCDSRKMNHHFFDLLASGTPTEIRVRDCSWLTEEQFTKTFDKIDASNLTVLQLDQCGRCLPDYVLLPILAFSPSQFSALTNISLKGACRLSDDGLKALVDSAPALRSVNLGCCSLLTVDAINYLADKLGPVLKEFYIDECFDLDAKHILHALLKLEQLEVLSVAHNESIDNSFIINFVAARGQKMKELVLANCTKLTDKAVRAISKSCPGLCAIDLTNVCKLKDKSLAHLAKGCPKIQILKFCRNTFSDEAVAAYLEACGAPLRELSLNHVKKVAHHTATSLANHARNLETLDLSFCREMTNEALGLIADSCSSLKTLKLFGCTQITKVFTDGHSNEGVKIIGLVESQILKNIEAIELLPLRYSAA